jgi:hypothetical protein
MAKNPLEGYRVAPAQIFVCKAIPSPPGKRFRGKHIFPGEEPSLRVWWFVTTLAGLVAFAGGLLTGYLIFR